MFGDGNFAAAGQLPGQEWRPRLLSATSAACERATGVVKAGAVNIVPSADRETTAALFRLSAGLPLPAERRIRRYPRCHSRLLRRHRDHAAQGRLITEQNHEEQRVSF